MYIQNFYRKEDAIKASKRIHRYMSEHNDTSVQDVLNICDDIRGVSIGWKNLGSVAPPVIFETFDGYQVMLPEPERLVRFEDDEVRRGFHVNAFKKNMLE